MSDNEKEGLPPIPDRDLERLLGVSGYVFVALIIWFFLMSGYYPVAVSRWDEVETLLATWVLFRLLTLLLMLLLSMMYVCLKLSVPLLLAQWLIILSGVTGYVATGELANHSLAAWLGFIAAVLGFARGVGLIVDGAALHHELEIGDDPHLRYRTRGYLGWAFVFFCFSVIVAIIIVGLAGWAL